ncbi:MAG: hypothetical protein IJY62_06005 [Clostridia bacterium]|nr:hypothetical protein [Clostridia bacterium]
MKKIVSFLLTVCTTLSVGTMLTACEEPVDPELSSGVNEETWNTAVAPANFDNVTFSIEGAFLDGLAEGNEGGEFSYVCKVDGDSATMNGETLGSESVAGLKSVYINTAIEIIEDFAKFTYDEDSKTYKSNQDIIYTVTVMGYEAEITAKDVVVTVDANTNIASIFCTMVQSFSQNGVPTQYTLSITFTYSNYGTTVIA